MDAPHGCYQNAEESLMGLTQESCELAWTNLGIHQKFTKQHLFGHLLPISWTIQVRQTIDAIHYWRSKGLTHKRRSSRDPFTWTIDRLARTSLHRLWAHTRCRLKDQLKAVDDKEGWRKRISEIHDVSAIWSWYKIVFLFWEFFTLALADGFWLESEWRPVSSSLQDSF